MRANITGTASCKVRTTCQRRLPVADPGGDELATALFTVSEVGELRTAAVNSDHRRQRTRQSAPHDDAIRNSCTRCSSRDIESGAV